MFNKTIYLLGYADDFDIAAGSDHSSTELFMAQEEAAKEVILVINKAMTRNPFLCSWTLHL